MIDTWAVMRSLPLVASVLGKKYGVNVVIGGADAYTDGATIHLPAMPPDMPEVMLAFVRGFLDHESAHVRETDFRAVEAARLSPLERHIWNSLEDYRVENKLASIFPGCRQNFDWLIKHVFESDQDYAPQAPAAAVLDWVLLEIRAWDVPCLGRRRDDVALHMDALFPGLRPLLGPVFGAARRGCHSNLDTIAFAQDIVRIINQFRRNMAQNAKGAGGDPLADTAAQATPQVGEGASGVGGDAAAPEAAGSVLEGLAEDAQGSAHPKPPDNAGNSVSEQVRDALDGLLCAREEDLPQNLGNILAQTLRDVSTDFQDSSFTVAVAAPKPTEPLTGDDILEARQTSVALRSRLSGAVQTRVLQQAGGARRGRLDTGRLYRIATSESRVFRAKVERKGLDTAVHILLDCSSSMMRRMHFACSACYAVASALQLSGINIAVTAFPGDQGTSSSYATVSPILSHGQRVHANMDVVAYGSTPMGESVWWVMQQMLMLGEKRKIILIVTDGEPDSLHSTTVALEHAARTGFEIYGLGIASNAIGEIMPGKSSVVNALAELPDALFALLETAVCRV